jgi:hypothetical protein
MSTLAEFKRAERELAMRVRAFQEMKQSPEVQKAMAFEKALDDFLAVHKVSRSSLYELLSIEFEADKKPANRSHHKKPATAVKKSASKPATGKRVFSGVKIRTFKNPHTGEELVVRGNRDGKFNAWNAQYGADVVRSWKTSEVDAPPKAATN